MEIFRNEKPEIKKITIEDVADALNVSKTTVSRAMSGKGRVSETTRRRILDYIEKNDYKPNVIAKGLAQQKTYNIAFVIPSDCNLVDMPFFQNSMQGICETASQNDYDVMLVTVAGDDIANLERMAANHKTDGVILSRSLVRNKAADFLKEQDIPFVLMGSSSDETILQVDNDHEAGCRELVVNLINSGLTRVGLIGGSREYVVNHMRENGYRSALEKAGLVFNQGLVYNDCDAPQKTELAVNMLIKNNAECIICMDDAICSFALQALAKGGIAVPDKMQIASFYDSSLLRNITPAVTSLLFDDKALGALTCLVLLKYIRGDEVQARTLLGYEIAYRASTKMNL